MSDFYAKLAVTVAVVALSFGAISMFPAKEHRYEHLGITTSVEQSRGGGTIITTDKTRFIVKGTWKGLAGQPLVMKTAVLVGPEILSQFRASKEVCVENTDVCAPFHG